MTGLVDLLSIAVTSLRGRVRAKEALSFDRARCFGCGLALVIAVLTSLPGPVEVLAQALPPSGEEAFQEKARRLEQSVYRRPRAGATFDLWQQHFTAAGRQTEWVQQADARRRQPTQDAKAQLVWGLVCERVGDRPGATQAYRVAAEIDPDDYYAPARLADCLLRDGNIELAATQLSTALSRPMPRSEYLRLAKQTAEVFLRLGRRADTLQVYRQLSERFDGDTRVIAEVASLLQQAGDTDGARQLWLEVSQTTQNPEQRFEADWELASFRLQAGDTDAALHAFRDLLGQVQPSSWRATELRQVINRTLLEVHGPSGPVTYWQREREANPHDLVATVESAQALAHVDRLDDAIALYRQAIERAPARRDLQQEVVQLLLRQGKSSAAMEQLQQLAEANPHDLEIWFELGQRQLQQSATTPLAAQEQAIASWRHAVDLRPSDGALARRAAELCRGALESADGGLASLPPTAVFDDTLRQQQTTLLDAAESFYREAVRREPIPEHLERLGEFLHRRQQPDQAVQTWKRIARDGSATAWLDASRVMLRYGYLDAALAASQTALDLDPQQIATWRQQLDVLLARHENDTAVETAERMQQVQAEQLDWQQQAWQLQATTIVEANRLDAQIERLQSHVSHDAADVGTLWVLALLLDTAGRSAESLSLMERVIERTGASPSLLRRYAMALADAGQSQQAIRQYRRLIELPAAAELSDCQRLIDLQLRQGDKVEAARTAAVCARIWPRDAEAYQLQAQVASASGQIDAQLAALRQAVNVAPRDVSAQRHYIQALVDAQQTADALEQVGTLLDSAATLNEKISSLAWTLSWATENEQQQRLVHEVQQRRLRDTATGEDWSRSLVFLWEQIGQPRRALEELQGLHALAPLDLTLLRQLVELAEATRQPELAVQYQQQVVHLDTSAQPLEKLARLYRQAGRLDDATRIWERLLDLPTSANDALGLIDQLIYRDDLFAAQRLSEAALSRFTDDWRLAYRAGLLHLAMEQYGAARDTLESILVQAPGAGPASTKLETAEDDLQPLIRALIADSHWREIVQRRETLGARHAHTWQRFADRELVGTAGSSSLAVVQVFSAVACLRGLPANYLTAGVLSANGDAEYSANARQAILAAHWAMRHYDQAWRFARQAVQQNSAAALPRWVMLMTPPSAEVLAEGGILLTEESYQWLLDSRPAAARQLQQLHTRSLLYTRTAPDWWPRVQAEINAASDIAQLSDLAILVNQQADESRRRFALEILSRASEFASRGTMRVSPDSSADLRELLLHVVGWDFVPVASRQAFITAWLPSYLMAARQHAVTENDPKLNRQDTVFADLAERLAVSLQRAENRLTVRQNHPLSDPTDIDNQTRVDVGRGYAVLQILKGVDVRQILPDGSVVIAANADAVSHVGEAEPPLFPDPSLGLDRPTLQTLAAVAVVYPDHTTQQQFRRSLAAVQAQYIGNDDVSRTLGMGEIALLWSWQRQDEALEQLEREVAARPQHVDLALALARAYLQSSRLPQAQRLIHGEANLPWDPTEIADLRNELQRRWTTQTHWHDLIGHEGAVTALAVDPTGQRLASVGVDGRVRIWDATGGKLIREMVGHNDILIAVAFSPDGQELATAGYDREIRRWRTADGESLSGLTGHTSTVRSLQYSSDGDQLLSAGDDRSLILWDLHAAELVHRMSGHRDAVLCARFGINAPEAISSGQDQTLRRWNLDTGQMVATVAAHEGAVRAFVLTDLHRVIGGGDAGQLRVWDLPSQPQTADSSQRLLEVDAAISDVALRSDGQTLAIGRHDHRVELWNVSARQEVLTVDGHLGRVLSVVWAPDGSWWASAGLDGVIKLWRFPDGT